MNKNLTEIINNLTTISNCINNIVTVLNEEELQAPEKVNPNPDDTPQPEEILLPTEEVVQKVRKKRNLEFGSKRWTENETSLVKFLILLGKKDKEIAEILGNRTYKAVNKHRLTLLKSGKINLNEIRAVK